MTTKTGLTFSLIFFTILFLAGLGHAEKPHYDFIISDARIIDGTGAPWFVADIGIVGDRLVAIGDLSKASAVKRLNAAGLGKWRINICNNNRSFSLPPRTTVFIRLLYMCLEACA